MSTSDGGATTWTPGSSSGEGAPAQEEQAPQTSATCQQTAAPLFEVRRTESTNDAQDKQVDKLKEEDALCLTNIHKFISELVWRKVVQRLKKKADIENCSGASPFFGNLLQAKRESEAVLPTVFGILSKRYCDEENKDESYKETNVQSIPWQIPVQTNEPHKMTPILKCRLVCKKWNAAIEEIHQNEDAGHYLMDQDLNEVANKLKWITECLDGESKVVEFLGQFEPTHYDAVRQVSTKCPFLGRFVSVSYNMDSVENQQAYFNRLKEIFEKFGDHVWYFKFWWSDSKSVVEDDRIYIYRKLKQFVELMPNLKVLRIVYLTFPLQPKEVKEHIHCLEEEIQRNPFPQRTKLEMISIEGIPGVLSNHLVHQNRQMGLYNMSERPLGVLPLVEKPKSKFY